MRCSLPASVNLCLTEMDEGEKKKINKKWDAKIRKNRNIPINVAYFTAHSVVKFVKCGSGCGCEMQLNAATGGSQVSWQCIRCFHGGKSCGEKERWAMWKEKVQAGVGEIHERYGNDYIGRPMTSVYVAQRACRGEAGAWAYSWVLQFFGVAYFQAQAGLFHYANSAAHIVLHMCVCVFKQTNKLSENFSRKTQRNVAWQPLYATKYASINIEIDFVAYARWLCKAANFCGCSPELSRQLLWRTVWDFQRSRRLTEKAVR